MRAVVAAAATKEDLMAFESVRAYVQLASGLGEMTKARAMEAAQGLLTLPGADEVTRRAVRASALADQLLEAAKANRANLLALVQGEVESALKRAEVARVADVDAARSTLAALTHDMAELRAMILASGASAVAGVSRSQVARRVAGSGAVSTAARHPQSAPAAEPPSASKSAAKKAAAKKAPAKKAVAKKAPAKRAAVKKAPAKRAAVKKAPAKRAAAKKAAAPRAAAKEAAATETIMDTAVDTPVDTAVDTAAQAPVDTATRSASDSTPVPASDSTPVPASDSTPESPDPTKEATP